MFKWLKEKIDYFFRYIRIKYMPKGLLARSIAIIFIPLILLQVIMGFVFFDNHWQTVGRRLANIMTGDIAVVISLMDTFPGEENQDWIFALAQGHMMLDLNLKKGETLNKSAKISANNIMINSLKDALAKNLKRPFTIKFMPWEKNTIINIELDQGVLQIKSPSKRFFSATTVVFIALMISSSLILFMIAYFFMKNQIRAVNRLANAVDDFGKGHDAINFKPEGAKEVKKIGNSFILMKDRIKRQISERTNMLSGVSHDLRTPITRLKLELAMMENVEGIEDIKSDILDMEKMIEGYLSFVRGEGTEKTSFVDLSKMLEKLVYKFSKNNEIDLHIKESISLNVRSNAFERALNNIISNAVKYAKNISIKMGKKEGFLEILIDDDGPGIAKEKRQDVFKAFVRIDESRNPNTGGVGLGLSIAKDIIHSHGGKIVIEDSPFGGARFKILIPL